MGLIDSTTGLAYGDGLFWLQGGLGNGALSANSPVNIVAPSIDGNPVVSDTLTAVPGTWQGQATITLTYQWYDDNGPISGATDDTYVIDAGEEGLSIYLIETATDDLGSANAKSASVGPVTA